MIENAVHPTDRRRSNRAGSARPQPRLHPLCAAIALACAGLISQPSAEAAAVLELSSLNGSNGFRLDGVAVGDGIGSALSRAGDIDGDGIADLIIGARYADPNGESSGSSYVLFGSDDGFAPVVRLETLDGSNGFRMDGVQQGELSGFDVAGIGDIDGDGFDDVLIGAPLAGEANVVIGRAYVVFGRGTAFPAVVPLSGLDGSNGFTLDGADRDEGTGRAVAGRGDIDGDGVDDLIVGAPFARPNGSNSGSSYVVFGRDSGGFEAVVDLELLSGADGVRINGVAFDHFSGLDVAIIGDLNGDGVDDLLVGAPYADPNGTNSGSSYVVFGQDAPFSTTIELLGLDGSNGFRLDGAGTGTISGWSVSAAGDVNGDGIDDLIIGAPYADRNALNSGSSYVVFGRDEDAFPPAIDLDLLDGSDGFRLDGIQSGDRSGFAVAHSGDINGDGVDDIVVGSDVASTSGLFSGSSYLVFGRTDGFDPAIDLASLDGANGLRIDGAASRHYSGRVLDGAGDINGDGIDDLLISATGAGYSNMYAGSVYVLFGNAAPRVPPGASGEIVQLEDEPDDAGRDLAGLVEGSYEDAEPFAGAALDEDPPDAGVGLWQYRAGDADPWQALPTGLSPDNALLLAPDAALRFVPAFDYDGTIEPLFLRLWDGSDAGDFSFGPGQDIRATIGSLGGFSNDENRLPVAAIVLPVNDPPDFTASDPPAVLQDSGPQIVPGWVTAFTPGPATEADQQVAEYRVSAIGNADLFAELPSIDPAGNLSYRPAPGESGSSSFAVQVRDDGGTANGGVDLSPAQVFTITVRPDAIYCDAFDTGGCE